MRESLVCVRGRIAGQKLTQGSAKQILIYELGTAKERAAKRENASAQGSADAHKDDAHKTIKHVMASTVENSHKRQVSDLRWLPPDGNCLSTDVSCVLLVPL